MTKRHNKTWIMENEVTKIAEQLLASIALIEQVMETNTANYKAMVAPLTAQYQKEIDVLKNNLAADEKELITLMKKNKAILFDGTDVVNLQPGSLIREKGDKVSIPKTALEACKSNGFKDVIKVVESLDRPAIEKWPDAKLVLIGAERKPSEEFKYNIKK